MIPGPRITLHIDRLRVAGMGRGDAAALADGLRAALAAQIAANPQMPGAAGADRMRISLPPAVAQGPADLGRAAGQCIGSALTGVKGGR